MSTATATTIKERPIIFGAESVRAILGGYKDVTRRVMKRQPKLESVNLGMGEWDKVWLYDPGEKSKVLVPVGNPDMENYCHLGRVGQRLWVREVWGDVTRAFQGHDCELPQVIAFRADEGVYNADGEKPHYLEKMNDSGIVCSQWKSPIHMPRWASRITLEIVSVRVERLKEITDEDILREGVKPFPIEPYHFSDCACLYCCEERQIRRDNFRNGWNFLNSNRGFGWDTPQWVWRIEFNRLSE